jgi:hypothetical protein
VAEQFPTQETITPEQHSAFLAFGQLCARKILEQRSAVQPEGAVSVSGNTATSIGLESPATGRRLYITDWQRFGILYKVYARPLAPGEECPQETYTLTQDHELRKRVFSSQAELDEDRRQSWEATTNRETRPFEEEYGSEVLSANDTYALIDEMTRAQWDRAR